MRVEVAWRENNLSFGEDDPHHGTAKEGQYAVLLIDDIAYKCSDYAYSEHTPQLLQAVADKLNHGG